MGLADYSTGIAFGLIVSRQDLQCGARDWEPSKYRNGFG